jgi:DNA-binding Lrp family transcriptional regulator
MLVYASDIEELSDILKNRIMKIKGVKSTITSIALSPQKGLKCLKAATETAVSDNKNSM